MPNQKPSTSNLRLALENSPRPFGATLVGTLSFPSDAPPPIHELELEICARNATKGDRIPIMMIFSGATATEINFSMPLWRAGRFELIIWLGKERSNSENISVRPKERTTRLEANLETDKGKITLSFQRRASWLGLAALAAAIRLRPDSSEIPVSASGIQLFPPLQGPPSKLNTLRLVPAGTFVMSEDHALSIQASGTRGQSVEPLASVISGMDVVESLCKAAKDAKLLALEIGATAEQIMPGLEKETSSDSLKT